MTASRYDAAVVGGGLAGRVAALAVAKLGLNTVHLAPAGPPDRRTSALMQPSVRYLQDLGVLPDPPDFGEKLHQIRIIDATKRLLRAPETLFDSAEAGLDAFGWNLANMALAERCEVTELLAQARLEDHFFQRDVAPHMSDGTSWDDLLRALQDRLGG